MKKYRIYKTDYNKYSIETITKKYFHGIDNLTENQANLLIDILILNGYEDATNED